METKEKSMIEQMIDIIIDKKILFLDLETTGLPLLKENNNYPDYRENAMYDTSRILQIGWCYCEKFSKQTKPLIGNINSVIRKPEDFNDIPQKSILIHGITYEKTQIQGILINQILEGDFGKSLMDCDYIVAYNVKFDFNVLANEIHRTKNQKLIEKIQILEKNGTICMMNASTLFLGGSSKGNPQGNENFYPHSQKKVYELMYSDEPVLPQHDAGNDIYTMMKILEYMITHSHNQGNQNSGKLGDQREEMMLKKLYEKQMSICDISMIHQRTALAIQMRIKKLGINKEINDIYQEKYEAIHNTRRKDHSIKTRIHTR